MKARWLFVLAAAVAIATAVFHWQALGVADGLAADSRRVRAEARGLARKASEQARRVADLQQEASPLPPARGTPASSAPNTGPRPEGSAEAAAASATMAPSEPELRALQVQAFVSEQRLRFGGLLQRVGFSPSQLQAFDRIQATYQQAMVDPTYSAAERAQAAQSRDAALEDLFGASHDRWREANRTEPARAVVAQIVQHAFQGAGAFTSVQVDELTRLVGEHRLTGANDRRGGSARYDWDAIIERSATILTETQRKHVITAIEFLRTSEEMAAIAAQKKS